MERSDLPMVNDRPGDTVNRVLLFEASDFWTGECCQYLARRGDKLIEQFRELHRAVVVSVGVFAQTDTGEKGTGLQRGNASAHLLVRSGGGIVCVRHSNGSDDGRSEDSQVRRSGTSRCPGVEVRGV